MPEAPLSPLPAPVYVRRSALRHPLGASAAEVLENLEAGRRLPTAPGAPGWARPAEGGRLDPRERKKMDAFSALAVEASLDLGLQAEEREGLGLFLGSALGGIGFAEAELGKLYAGGPRQLSPYLSIAMFYSSNLAQLSIRQGCHGPCSLFSEGSLSSGSALTWAWEQLRLGLLPRALAGGSEAPTAELGTQALRARGLGVGAGAWLSDACALLYLEAGEAGEEGLELVGAGEACPRAEGGGAAALRRAMGRCLLAAGWEPGQVDLLFLNRDGLLANEANELAALAAFFGAAGPALLASKPRLGHCLGAAQAQDMALLMACLERGRVPAGLRFAAGPFRQRPLELRRPGQRALLLGVDFFGRCLCLGLRGPR